MSKMEAIIWGIDPGSIGIRGCPLGDMHVLEAMIHPNVYHAEKYGAVYWDHGWSVTEERRKSTPMTGYLYVGQNVQDVPQNRRGTVSFRLVVERILTLEELSANEEEHMYIPPWRRQCLLGRWPDGSPHDPSPTWIKTSHISILSRGYSPREMGIDADFVRRGVYVNDLDWR